MAIKVPTAAKRKVEFPASSSEIVRKDVHGRKYGLDADILEYPICSEHFTPPVYQCPVSGCIHEGSKQTLHEHLEKDHQVRTVVALHALNTNPRSCEVHFKMTASERYVMIKAPEDESVVGAPGGN